MYRRFLFLIALFGAAAPAAAQPPRMQSPAEAMAQDGAEFVRAIGVSPEEGERRLRAQQASIPATEAIQREFAGRFAGVAVEHRPEFRILFQLTGDEPVPERTFVTGGMRVPIIFRTGVRSTRQQVLAAIYRHREAIDEVMSHEGLAHDPRTGALLVVADRDDLDGREQEELEDRLARLTGVPVRIRIIQGENNDSGIEGGARVEGHNPGESGRFFCTTGYTVTDGRRTGVVTAAHCPNILTYYDPHGGEAQLELVGEWGARFQDVQVLVGGGVGQPIFYSDRARREARPVAAAQLRSRTRAGDVVCHRGEASGYSCAQIDLVDYAPPGELCAGRCHPMWVTVKGPGCRNGDSGGPVFLGTTALGILKGGNYASDGRCNFYYYMSTDFLPPGWSLLLAPGPDAASVAAP